MNLQPLELLSALKPGPIRDEVRRHWEPMVLRTKEDDFERSLWFFTAGLATSLVVGAAMFIVSYAAR